MCIRDSNITDCNIHGTVWTMPLSVRLLFPAIDQDVILQARSLVGLAFLVTLRLLLHPPIPAAYPMAFYASRGSSVDRRNSLNSLRCRNQMAEIMTPPRAVKNITSSNVVVIFRGTEAE